MFINPAVVNDLMTLESIKLIWHVLDGSTSYDAIAILYSKTSPTICVALLKNRLMHCVNLHWVIINCIAIYT